MLCTAACSIGAFFAFLGNDVFRSGLFELASTPDSVALQIKQRIDLFKTQVQQLQVEVASNTTAIGSVLGALSGQVPPALNTVAAAVTNVSTNLATLSTEAARLATDLTNIQTTVDSLRAQGVPGLPTAPIPTLPPTVITNFNQASATLNQVNSQLTSVVNQIRAAGGQAAGSISSSIMGATNSILNALASASAFISQNLAVLDDTVQQMQPYIDVAVYYENARYAIAEELPAR